jgi:hypothetical protein
VSDVRDVSKPRTAEKRQLKPSGRIRDVPDGIGAFITECTCVRRGTDANGIHH